MNKRLLFLLITLLIVPFLSSKNTKLPYFTGFESRDDNVSWIFPEHVASGSTQWNIGNGTHFLGNSSMYLSSDDGATASYSGTTAGYTIVAYKKFTLDEGSYELSFDCRVQGEPEDKDALRVAWVPANVTPNNTYIGASFPKYATEHSFISSDSIQVFQSLGWSSHVGTVKVEAGSNEYYLAFVWKMAGGPTVFNPGACIDNVQLDVLRTKDNCLNRPQKITTKKGDEATEITWQGSADSYELIYHNISNDTITSSVHVKNISSPSYNLYYDSIPQDVYAVKVRSICGGDTSMWSSIYNVLQYDPSLYCFDFLNLYADNVVTTHGRFRTPFSDTAVVDSGYGSINSIHTIHYRQDEYDIRTGYKLKTVPDGAVASVRISNWREMHNGYRAPTASISYSYEVPQGVGVLQLNYAAVLQYEPTHPDSVQSRIIVEILDEETGKPLSECTEVMFTPSEVVKGNYGYWNTYYPPEDLTINNEPIVWSDWRKVNINVGDYVGKKVKIRLVLKPCGGDYHFGYAYFTLGCESGQLEGISCSEKPNEFSATDGFKYRWYLESNPLDIISTERKFPVTQTDTCTYCVDLISTEDTTCYYTLTASTLPRIPVPDANIKVEAVDCKNILTFENNSVVKSVWEGVERVTDEKCTSFEWNLGEYGTFYDETPDALIFPNEGDTIDVTFRAIMAGGCDSVVNFTLKVPAIGNTNILVDRYVLDGTEVVVNGKTYTEEGTYTDTIDAAIASGCDTIYTIKLTTLVTDTIIDYDTICSNEEVLFYNETLRDSGTYVHHIPSFMGEDSVYHEMHLHVNQNLEMSFATDRFTICADEPNYLLPYTIDNGMASDYEIIYSDKALAVGFVNSGKLSINANDTAKIIMPYYDAATQNYVRPDEYQADLVFYNSDCGDLTFPVSFEVHYPSSLLAQRWNDVIGLRNEEYNGGYTFNAYQWYKNDSILIEETSSILYLAENVDFGAEYKLRITREDDGVTAFTCPIVLTEQTNIEDKPHVVVTQSEIQMKTKSADLAKIYSVSGRLISSHEMKAGDNSLPLPQQAGVYIVKTMSAVFKVVVR